MKNLLIKNVRKMPELNGTERNLIIILGQYHEGECPSDRELARKTGLKESTIKKAMRTLRKKDMISEPGRRPDK